LEQLREQEKEVELLLTLAQDEEVKQEVRIAAAQALGRLGERGKAVELLLTLAQDREVEAWVRRDAAQALGSLGEREKATELLLLLVQDEEVQEGVRRDAVQALGQLGASDEKVLDALAQVARTEHEARDVRNAAWAALWTLANAAGDRPA
jgi:HEAT repeat protein